MRPRASRERRAQKRQWFLNASEHIISRPCLSFPNLMALLLWRDGDPGPSKSQLWKHFTSDLERDLTVNKLPHEPKFLLNTQQVAKRCENTPLCWHRCCGESGFHRHSAHSELFIRVTNRRSILFFIVSACFVVFCLNEKRLAASIRWQVFSSCACCTSILNQSMQSVWRRQD